MINKLMQVLPDFIRSKIEGRQNLLNILSNTGWLFADRLLRMAGGLLIGAWVARYLGPDQFGILNYAIAFVAIFSAIASLGLDAIVIRDIIRDPNAKEEILGTSLILKLVSGIATFGICMVSISLLRPDDVLMLKIVALTSAGLIFQSFDAIDFWFQSQVQSKYTVYVKNASFLLVAAIRIILIMNSASLMAFVWASLLEVVLGSFGMVYVYYRNGYTLRLWRVRSDRMVQLLKASWPLILQGLVIMIYMRIDQIMLGELSSTSELGNYSAAVRLVEVWYFIPLAITASLFPTIIQLKGLDSKIYLTRIQQLYDLMIWMAVIFAFFASLFASPVINLLFGKEYQHSAAILTIQAWMAASVFFGVARQKWLTAEGRLMDGLQVEIIGALMNIGANLILIPRYGAIGASIASLISAFGSNFVASMYLRSIRLSMRMYFYSLLLPLRFVQKA